MRKIKDKEYKNKRILKTVWTASFSELHTTPGLANLLCTGCRLDMWPTGEKKMEKKEHTYRAILSELNKNKLI